MSKSKNRNRNDQSADDGIDSIDFDVDDFGVEENNELIPSPEEPPAPIVEQEEPKPVEPEPIEEHKEEPMPTTEVKHQEVTPAAPAQTAASATKPIVTPKDTATTRFNALSRKYITLARNGIKTEEQKKEAVDILSDIVFLVTTSHDRAVFDACLSFFLTNRAIMLSEQTVISSVSHYADQTKINRIVQFYVVFTSLVESKILRKRYTININHVRDVFNNRKLAEWLTDKR